MGFNTLKSSVVLETYLGPSPCEAPILFMQSETAVSITPDFLNSQEE